MDAILAKQRAGFEEQVEQMRKLFDQSRRRAARHARGKLEGHARATSGHGDRSQARRLREGLRQQRAVQERERELAMKELDAVWPTDHRVLVANRLRHFLDVSKDVAYAQLVVKDGAKVFADPALEAKPKEGRCVFGPENRPRMPRAFAQKWLNELQAQGIK